MPAPRFHLDRPLAVGATVRLTRDATRHALRALRLRHGDPLVLFDGRGGEYAAELADPREPEAEVRVVRHDPREAELPWPITVAQGLSSGDLMDWTVQKSVELGAAAFQPLAAARSVTRLSPERAVSRRAHWQAVAIAASEQCGRNRVADVEPVRPLAEWLATAPGDAMRVVLAPDGDPIRALPRPSPGRRVLLLVGPEGGFTDAESQAAIAAGFARTTLGPRVLRTETAAAAAIAMLSTLWEAD